ncbi:cell wall protein SED1-like [Benincasa hispida]|uniref:cell wall protein SED1-like n=1 Tax=Benincasa hispida TaxID=102211 RepID=UPI00190051A9|nr:cell wall protein SED1-like [Benincasa hispida]XP_038889076.1 cell wall protein SED1-like [Benincasa hispida]
MPSTFSPSPIIRTTHTQSPTDTSTDSPAFPPSSSDRLPTNNLPDNRLPPLSSIQPTDCLPTSCLPSDHLPNDRSTPDRLPSSCNVQPTNRLPTNNLPNDRLSSDRLPNTHLPTDRLQPNYLPSDRLSPDSSSPAVQPTGHLPSSSTVQFSPDAVSHPVPINTHPMITRKKVGIFKPKILSSQTHKDWSLTKPTRVTDALKTSSGTAR